MSYANRLSTRKICTNQHDSVAEGRYRKRQTKSNIIGKEAREEEEQDAEAYDITQWGRGRRGWHDVGGQDVIIVS